MHVADLLANSPHLPLIIYWGNSGTFDTDDSIKIVRLVLDNHRDRVRRITLHMSKLSLRKVLPSMNGTFPILETLQLYCLSENRPRTALPSMFEAPNLRHLQLSDLTIPPQSSQLLSNVTTRPSIITFSLGEITIKPATLIECLASMPHLKVLKIGVLFVIPSERAERRERALSKNQPESSSPLALTDLEEFEYQGISDYLEVIAARISAPFLKKLSITLSDTIHDSKNVDSSTFKYLSRLINGAAYLAFQFARVRFKDGFSVVMDHDELWTGRGAFELKVNYHAGYRLDANAGIGFVAKICRVLVPMPSTVQSLLLEDGDVDSWAQNPNRQGWLKLLGIFDNVKTLRVAGRFVEELDKALKPDDGSKRSAVPKLLLKLEEIVLYGPESEFAAFVEARRVAGLPVRVVGGPKNRLMLY